MKFFSDTLASIMANAYFKFLLYASLSIVAAFLIKVIFKNVIKPLTKRSKTRVDDIIINNLSGVIFYIILIVGLKASLRHFEWQSDLVQNILETLMVVIVSLFIIRSISGFSKVWMKDWKSTTRGTAEERVIPLFQKVLKALVIVLAALFILSAWNVNIAPLLATAGIAGLAVGLAVKDTLANIIGGIQLVMDKTFKVNDMVALESGELGIVQDIGLRSTKLRTFDNELITVPNGYLANSKLKNYTLPDLKMRLNVFFGVAYGSDPGKVKKVILKVAREEKAVLDDPASSVDFLKMGDFALEFVLRAWVSSYTEVYSTTRLLTERVYLALNKARIEIPFPTRTIYTRK